MKASHNINAGVGERMQYLAHEYNDTTIRFVLHYPGFLNPDILCAATAAVIEEVDVLTIVLGMDTKLAVGTNSMIIALVALTGAVSHVAMGAQVELIPGIIVTVVCTAAAVVSARFANKVSERVLNVSTGIVLIAVSLLSLILGA